MALTPKQKAFCQNYVSSNNALKAYKAAYDWRGSDESARSESSKLLARDEIQRFLNTIREPYIKSLQSQNIGTFEQKRAILWDIINSPDASNSDKIRALDTMAKLDKDYININANINTENTLQNVSTDDLKALIG